MYGIHLSIKRQLFKIKALKLEIILRLALILALVIDMEIAEIANSFLAVYYNIYLYSSSYCYNKSI